MKNLFILLIFSIWSCTNQNSPIKLNDTCNENMEFRDKFNNCISKIDSFFEYGHSGAQVDPVKQQEFVDCINKLTRITQLKHHVTMDYRFGYLNRKDLEIDILQWQTWYEEHRCEGLKW